ncbi:TetR/AcrR family transcriptional regulator [Nocardia carnea]|uniref:TetR/AcrR family transcriptional regulator n=1 Tax=Nocardia carnea TaxID=37328 RepID=UPI0024573B8C|nr:TetR/AcrR family transcriptional regulator [Nocardia carnea]
MRPEISTSGQKRPSFIEQVRRKQILENAVTVFAESGYAKTSLARIAERAGISKGVISYHFAGKDELMERLVEHVYEEITAFVTPRVTAEETVLRRIGARIRAVADYVRAHPAELRALTEVLHNLLDDNGRPVYGDRFNESIYQGLEAEFRTGQDSGELRRFDTRVMAVTVQAGIDAMIAYWHSYPEHDLGAHADELADLITHAIAANPPTAAGTKQ